MGRVLSMPGQAARNEDADAAVQRAMREAQEAAGLDDQGAARRMNVACGTSIITAAMWQCWLTGRDIPDAATFLRAVRLAGAEAGHILARLA